MGGIHGQEQTKLTITDYESYEEIEFEAWGDHSYGFTKADIESQFSIRYDEANQQTLLSINTDKVNKEDFVVLKDKTNGQFELSHYSLEDGLTGLEVFLKTRMQPATITGWVRMLISLGLSILCQV